MLFIVKELSHWKVSVELQFTNEEIQEPLFVDKQEVLEAHEQIEVIKADIKDTKAIEKDNTYIQSVETAKAEIQTRLEEAKTLEKELGVKDTELGVGKEIPIEEINPIPVEVEPIEIPEPIEFTPSTILIEQIPEYPEDPYKVVARIIDELREEYCGDVTPLETKSVDKDGKEVIIEKDLSSCPQFRIGEMTEFEILDYEPVMIEPIKEVITEEPVEDTITDPIIKPIIRTTELEKM